MQRVFSRRGAESAEEIVMRKKIFAAFAVLVLIVVLKLTQDAQVGIFEGRPVVEASEYRLRWATVEIFDPVAGIKVQVPYGSILYLYEEE